MDIVPKNALVRTRGSSLVERTRAVADLARIVGRTGLELYLIGIPTSGQGVAQRLAERDPFEAKP